MAHLSALLVTITALVLCVASPTSAAFPPLAPCPAYASLRQPSVASFSVERFQVRGPSPAPWRAGIT